MLLVTPEEMMKIDRLTIEQNGLASLVLMENAARSTLSHIPSGPVKILVGPGNNGGDGLVIARALYERGAQVEAVLFSETLSPEAEIQKKLAANWGVPIKPYCNEEALSIQPGDVIIDALFGTGLSRELSGHYAEAIAIVNRADVFRLAIDIPSGISGRTGQVLGTSLQAHLTVTFGLAKWGHMLYPGKTCCGRLVLTQPGFHPLALLGSDRVVLATKEVVRDILPTSWPTMHKGDNGRILLVTGSSSYPGAGVLSTLGALRGGGGLVFHACDQALADRMVCLAPEAIPVAKKSLHKLDSYNVLVVGSGLGKEKESESLGLELLERFKGPLVVDADALPLVKRFPIEKRKSWVLTPHPGELSQLLDKPVATLERDRIGSALEAAATLGATLCFKGAPTICATPEGRAYVNSTGNPLLAQGGSGDVLAGLIAAFIGYGLPSFEAAAAAVYIHGLAADLLAQSGAPRGAGAKALADNIPLAYATTVA